MEHYEKLFEALCTFESRWTKTASTAAADVASLEVQVIFVHCRHWW